MATDKIIYVAVCSDCYKLVGGPTHRIDSVKGSIAHHTKAWAEPHTQIYTYGRLAEKRDHVLSKEFGTPTCMICEDKWPCPGSESKS